MWALAKLLVLFSVVASSTGSLVPHESRTAAPKGFVNQGAAPSDQVIEFRLGLKSNNIDGLHDKLMSISTPGSEDFRQWLSAGRSLDLFYCALCLLL